MCMLVSKPTAVKQHYAFYKWKNKAKNEIDSVLLPNENEIFFITVPVEASKYIFENELICLHVASSKLYIANLPWLSKNLTCVSDNHLNLCPVTNYPYPYFF